MKTLRQRYPFSAIVGQEELKQALLLNLIYPGIGGVLIRKDFSFNTRNGRPRLPSASGRRSGSSHKSVSPGFC